MTKPFDEFSLAAVVATYDRPEDTAQLVRSIRTSLHEFRDEFPTVDMSFKCVVVCPKDDPVVSALESIDFAPLMLLETESSRAADNRDHGIQTVNHDRIAIVDSDCVVSTDWLREIYETIQDGNPDVIQGAYFYDFRPQQTWFTYAEALEDVSRFEGGQLDSRNLVVKRETYLEIGGYGAGHEFAGAGDDLVLRSRLEEINAEIAFAPSVKVFHKYPRTLRGNLLRYRWYGQGTAYVRQQYPEQSRAWASVEFQVLSAIENLCTSLIGRNEKRTLPQSLYLLAKTGAFLTGYVPARARMLWDALTDL